MVGVGYHLAFFCIVLGAGERWRWKNGERGELRGGEHIISDKRGVEMMLFFLSERIVVFYRVISTEGLFVCGLLHYCSDENTIHCPCHPLIRPFAISALDSVGTCCHYTITIIRFHIPQA